MMRTSLCVCLALVISKTSFSQNTEIAVKGKAKQAISGKGIVAKITYKSYPTGGLSGSFNDSTFSFSIFGSTKYVVTAEAPNHIPNTILVLPTAAKNGVIENDIVLTPSGQTIRLQHLIFDMSRAVIKPESFQELDQLVAFLKTNPKIKIQLEGHTDNQGNANANFKLSQDRVDAVKKYLTKDGISKDRIQTKAFGGTQPLSTENSEAARAMNRRVEMRVLEN
jgi:outer membrane protein OmpA-like peptidoglycan-associated protein